MSEIKTRPMVELHYRECACLGTGWIGAPGIGAHAQECRSERVIVLPYRDWEALGKPRTADELRTMTKRGGE